MKNSPHSKEKKEEKSDTKKSKKHILLNNLYLIKIAFKEAPYYTFHRLMGGFKHRFIVFIEHTFMIGYIIDAIQYNKPFIHVFWFILGVFIWVAVWAYFWANFLFVNVCPKAEEKIKKSIRLSLYKKAATIDLQCYDDPKFYTDFVWAMGEADKRVFSVLDSASNFIGSITGILIIAGYMLSKDYIGIFFVLTSFIGIFSISKLRNKLRLNLNERMRPIQRERDYIKRVLYLSDYAKEIRLSSIKEKLYKDFNDAIIKLEDEAKKGTKKLALLNFLSNYVFNTFLSEGAYLLYLLYRSLVLKNIGYGTTITLFRSAGSVRNCLMNLSYSIPQFQEHSLYIDKIRYFLDYDIKVESPKNPKALQRIDKLTLKNVAFKYLKDNILKNINLTIHQGEKIALVGYNGAGKTTLIKLLLRLYDVTGGQILVGQEDIKNFDINDYRNMFETVFQDYQLFASTIGENIVMNNTPMDKERADLAVTDGGFKQKLDEFEFGYDTPVTKEFDEKGILLSGGESQKLAISRALYKDSPIIILDEPSSALDPNAEYHLNQTMLSLGKDKTVIIISHRLSTTKLCDKIYMLDQGEIVEQGTHDQLMSLNGKYAYMYQLQAEKYRKAFQ